MATRKTTKATEPETAETVKETAAEAVTTAAEETTETVEETTAEAVTTAAEETTETVEETIRAKAVKTYRDKNTGKIVTAGTVLIMTAKRFAELSPRYVKRW